MPAVSLISRTGNTKWHSSLLKHHRSYVSPQSAVYKAREGAGTNNECLNSSKLLIAHLYVEIAESRQPPKTFEFLLPKLPHFDGQERELQKKRWVLQQSWHCGWPASV